MLFDVKTMFTEDGSIAATGVVGDTVDLGSAELDLSSGEPVHFGIVITEQLAGATTCAFTFSSAPSVGGSYTTVIATKAYAAADLKPGKEIMVPVPDGCQEFVQVATTATSVTAGKFTAGMLK